LLTCQLCECAWSQQGHPEVFSGNAETRNQARAFNQEAFNLYNEFPEKRIRLGQMAYDLAVKLNDSALMAEALNNIGEGYRHTGENLRAMDYYFKSYEFYTRLADKKGQATALDNIGRIYRFLGHFDDALEFSIKSLNISEEIGDQDGIAAALINSGVIYRNLGKMDKAMENYEKAMEICEKTGNKNLLVFCNISIGNIWWYRHDNDKALQYYFVALEITDSKGFRGENAAGVLNNIGNVYREKGDFARAHEYYQRSLGISEEAGDKNMIAITSKNIGITYEKAGDRESALEWLNKSLMLAERINLRKALSEVYAEIAQIYERSHEYDSALKYFKQYSILKDSIFNAATSDKIAVLQLGYELDKKEKENELLQKNLYIQQLKNSQQKTLRNFLIILTINFIVLMLLILSRYRIKTKAARELEKMNQQLELRIEERTRELREENIMRKKAQEAAEEANETKGRFLANISHEIRTPVNVVVGLAELMQKSPGILKEQSESLDTIKDASQHLLALLKNILDYSAMDKGKGEVETEPFDLLRMLDSVVNAFKAELINKGLYLNLLVDSGLPASFIGDENKIRQVMYNLIGNAVKFTDRGGINVEVKPHDGFDPSADVNRISFSISDTGIGISALKQRIIFQGFTQADVSSKRRYGGAGLGLTISKFLVELMGGNISVTSLKGRGSTFTFIIPIKTDRNKNVPARQKTNGKQVLNILVAEDNPLNAQVISAFLKRLGHNSSIAENGKVALSRLAREPFDAVIMDIEMPEMDGLEATRIIRAGGESVINPSVPIIALTAHALKDYERLSREAGMNHYLTKPPNIQKLESILNDIRNPVPG
jgi:signal transduction histidine kinase/CheY-like chemotaxis protein